MVDSQGRQVLLRGVNVNALAEYWKGTEFPTTFPLRRGDPRLMRSIGWNAVRLLVSWSRVEPQPGQYDEAYLDRVARAIRRLARNGIYSIVDLHQDAWGATLAAREGEVCAPPSLPALGWDGAPGWATLTPDSTPRCYLQFREASPAVYSAWQAFWTDATGPAGVGVQTRYVEMLGHVARRFARTPAVAGYDLMNEPNSFGPGDDARLSRLYERAHDAIREGEREARGFPHLILFEPSALWSAIGRGAPPPPDFDGDPNVVYAPHIYTGGFDGGPITREAFQIASDEAKALGGVPVVSGEWGADPDRAGPGGDSYFTKHQDLQDEFLFGATLWTWRESCGDPHKVGAYREGTDPAEVEVWGEFEVSCTDNSVKGLRHALVRALRRAYVRAAPGELDSMSYDERTGLLRARGSDASAGRWLVAFYPLPKHRPGGKLARRANVRRPAVKAAGLADLRVLRAPRGGVTIKLRTTAKQWSLRVGPRRRPSRP